ncbi:CHAT domain-containing protein [Kibdelosporangium aridum]|nr:CHAT domain-containing protein [Kibdelosporangium aridum]
MVDDPRLAECFTAFAARDYLACYSAAVRGPEPGQPDPLVFRQLIAICIQRLGQTDELADLPRVLLDTTADPFEKALIRLTFGQQSLDSARQLATNDEQLCQALFYAGARLVTLLQAAEAEDLLRSCASLDVGCAERRLAEIELAAMAAGDEPDSAEQAFELFDRRARAYFGQGRYDEAIRTAQEACDLARRTWGPDNRHLAQSMITLLGALSQAGRIEAAMELAPQALDLVRAHYDVDDPDFATLLSVIGYLYKVNGGFDEATRFYQAAARIWSGSAEHRVDSAAALNNMAQIAVAREDFDDAVPLFEQALDMLDGVADDLGLYAGVLNNLALVQSAKGDNDKAERLHHRALDHQRETLGEDHPQYAASLNNLAHLYKDQNRYAEAEPLLLRAVEILTPAVGMGHEHTLKSVSALLEIYQATGQQEAADRLIAEVRTDAEAVSDTGVHVLHPVPALTVFFQRLKSDLPAGREPQFAGGAIDWRSPAYQRLIAELADDFAEHRYGECLQKAILLNAYDTTHEVLQIWLMCFAQIPQTGYGRTPPQGFAGAQAAVGSLVADPWYSALVGLTIGQTSIDQAEQLADDDEKICQLRYYAAQRQIVDGHSEEALANLEACATSGVACFEAWMARRILRMSPRASDRDLANQVRALNLTVSDLLSRNDFAAAAGPAAEAWQLAQGLEDNTQERTVSHYNVGTVAYLAGDLPESESLLGELVTVARRTEHYDRTAVGAALNILGMIHTDLARFDLAESALLDALAELRLANRPLDVNFGQVQGNLAEVYREMGDIANAIQVSHKALESKQASLGREHPEYARTLNNLGLLYVEAGELRMAENLLVEAQRIRQAALPAGHADIGTSASSLAHLYLTEHRYEEAEAALRTGLEISRNVHGTDNLTYAVRLGSLANVYMMTGRLEQSRRQLWESREILRRVVGPLHPLVAGVTSNLSMLHAVEGDLRGAMELARESEEAAANLLSEVFGTASERQRLQLLGDVHWRLSAWLSLVDALGAPDEEVANAFDLVLRRKGIAGEADFAMRDAVGGAARPELTPKIDHVRSLQDKIARKTLSGPGPEGPAAHANLLAGWTEQKEQLEAELARTMPGMRVVQRMRELSGQSVRASLPPDSALIEIVHFGLVSFTLPAADETPPAEKYRYWAFVLRPEPHKSLQRVDLGDGDEIDRLVASYRDTIVASGASRDVAPRPSRPPREAERDAGTELRKMVFDKLGEALGDTRRLFICPDGDLSRLPWEVLPLGSDQRLIDEYEISYLGVGRDLLRLSTPSANESAAPVVVADPDFDLSVTRTPAAQSVDAQPDPVTRELRDTSMRFGRLAGTLGEGEAVATLLGVPLIAGAAATDAAVKSCRRPAVLHIATHGFFLPDPESARQQDLPLMDLPVDETRPFGRLSNADASPFLRSGLALAGANTWLAGGTPPAAAEDGILTAQDVSGMDLSGTQLVTLSACETGLGSRQRGEGVLGLRRAFILAGARTVVMSLWQVPDDETKTLMTDFYQRVLAGDDRAAALRAAQRELKKTRPEPFYWGAFICQGDPSRLVLRR